MSESTESIVADTPSANQESAHRSGGRLLVVGLLAGSLIGCATLAVGFWAGQKSTPASGQELPPIFGAAATATDTMAVATGPITADAEGVFFLDFITGDLQCLVYYPSTGRFGARYFVNVRQQLGGAGKARYLLATGAIGIRGASSNIRPANSLVYVTDVNSGMFAAYAIPFDRNAERSRSAQVGTMVPIEVGPIRNFQVRDQNGQKPNAIVDPGKNK